MGLVKKLGILGIAAVSFLPYSTSSVRSQEAPVYSGQRENIGYVPGELIVKFKEDPKVSGIKTKFDSVNGLNNKYGVKNYDEVFISKKEPKFQKLTLDEKIDVLDAMKAYSNDPNVEYAEPDYVLRPAFTPNDEFFDIQWAHDDCHTQAEKGWDIERGNPSTVIAIIDTGIDYAHEDLRDNMLGDCNSGCPEGKGYDFVHVRDDPNRSDDFFDSPDRERIPKEDYTDVDNDPMDFDGHGTAVAGVAAAKGHNMKGVAGVCHDCSIMPLRAGFAYLKDGEKAGGFPSSAIVSSILYAVDNGARIINMSFGGNSESETEKFAVNYARDNGVVLIAGAGNNSNSELFYPAANENVIAVAGTDKGKCTAPKIPEGRDPGSNYGEWIDVAAPCCNFTTTITGTGSDPSIPNYDGARGTSISSAYVSGLAGLILSKNPNLDRDEVKDIIREGVDKFGIDIPTPDQPIGTGRVNVYKTLQLTLDSLLPKFIRGASNLDNGVNISDAIFTLDYLFKQGQTPNCLDAADANDDGVIDISDPVRTILHLFVDGMTLPAPFPEAGIDPTDDNLDCNS